MADELRHCRICGKEKSLPEFRKGYKGRPGTYCRECAAVRLREWRANNPDKIQEHARTRRAKPEEQEKHRQRSRRRYHADKDSHRDGYLLRTFGISLAEYSAMHEAQDGKCAVCGEGCKSGRSLAVDHDHDTGAVRALLCMNCNRAIGWMQDSPDRLVAAAAYLLRYQDVLKEAL